MDFVLIMGSALLLILAAMVATASHQFGLRIAIKNLPSFILLLVPAFVLSILIFLFPTGWNYNLVYLFFPMALLTISFAMWLYAIINLKKIRQTGDILLEIRRSRKNLIVGIIIAVLGLSTSISFLFQTYSNYNTETEKIFWFFANSIFWFSSGLLSSSTLIKNWEIRERGIIAFGHYLPWEKIRFFQWHKEKRGLLSLHTRRRLLLLRTVHLPIPLEKREIVNEILSHNLATNSEG